MAELHATSPVPHRRQKLSQVMPAAALPRYGNLSFPRKCRITLSVGQSVGQPGFQSGFVFAVRWRSSVPRRRWTRSFWSSEPSSSKKPRPSTSMRFQRREAASLVARWVCFRDGVGMCLQPAGCSHSVQVFSVCSSESSTLMTDHHPFCKTTSLQNHFLGVFHVICKWTPWTRTLLLV